MLCYAPIYVYHLTGVKAEVVGKPEASFFLSALQDMQGSPEETIMIGDVSNCLFLA